MKRLQQKCQTAELDNLEETMIVNQAIYSGKENSLNKPKYFQM